MAGEEPKLLSLMDVVNGVIPNLVTNIVIRGLNKFEGTPLGNVLETVGLLSPSQQLQLRRALSKTLTSFMIEDMHPQYRSIREQFIEPTLEYAFLEVVGSGKAPDEQQLQKQLETLSQGNIEVRQVLALRQFDLSDLGSQFIDRLQAEIAQYPELVSLQIQIALKQSERNIIDAVREEGERTRAELREALKPEINVPIRWDQGRLLAVPELPPHFLPRTTAFEGVKASLLSTTSETVVVTGITKRVGIEGMGGIGKSVLAAAVVRDEEVCRAFPGDILWLTIGQTPQLPSLQAQLGEMLGDNPRNFVDMEDGKRRLSTLMADRACLLVLDDVWEVEHAGAFEVLGSKCRMLVTTRDASLITKLGAQGYTLDLLEPGEALALLAAWVRQPMDVLPTEAALVAKECGYLPLALAMVGAMVADESTWADVLAALKETDLAFIEAQFPNYPYPTILRAIQVSVDALKDDAVRYLELAVFPEDVRLPESAILTLWHGTNPSQDRHTFKERAARRLLKRMKQRSLLRQDEQGFYSLHDLQIDYIRKQMENRFAQLHQSLLTAYNANNQPWYTIPHDGYLYFYLAYHLMEAGRKDELHHLLVDSPEWMQAKFKACIGDSAYVNDLELLIQQYHDPLPAADLLKLVQLQSARQIVNHRVGSYGDQALKVLVWLDREQEALSHTYLRADAYQRFQGVLVIYQTLAERGQANQHLLDNLGQIVTTIESAYSRASALIALAIALAQAGQAEQADTVFEQAQQVAQGIDDAYRRAPALIALAQALAQAQRFEQAQQVAQGIDDAFWQADALRALAQALAQAQRFEQAQQVAQGIDDAYRRASALSALAQALAQAGQAEQADTVFEQAQQVAQAIESAYSRALALIALATAFAQAGQAEQADTVFEQAQQVAQGIEFSYVLTFPLSALATALAQAQRFEQAQQVAQGIDDAYSRADALIALATALAQAQRFEQAQQVAQGIDDAYRRADALRALAIALAQAGQAEQADTVFEQAQQVAQGIESADRRAFALSAPAIALAQAQRFEQAQQVAQGIEDADIQADALIAVAQALAQAQRFEQAQQVAQGIDDAYRRASALSALAQALAQAGQAEQADTVFEQAQQVAQGIDDAFWRALALSALATAFAQAGQAEQADTVFEQAQLVAQGIEDADRRTSALSALAIALAQAQRFEQAQQVAQGIDVAYRRTSALIALAIALAQAQRFEQAQQVAQGIDDAFWQADALIALAIALAQAQRFEQAQQVAQGIDDADRRASALSALAQALAQAGQAEQADTVFEQAQVVAQGIEDASRRASALRDLAQALAQAQRFEQAQVVAQGIEDADRRASALSDLATALAQAQRFEQAQVVAQGIEDAFWRAPALSALATALAQAGQPRRALTIFGFQDVDTFLRLLATWREGLIQTYGNEGHDLYLQVLIHATRILGWEQPGWAETHRLLVGEIGDGNTPSDGA